MEVEPEREQRWERWLDSGYDFKILKKEPQRTSDLCTSVQRWEGSRTQETRLLAQLGWGDLAPPSLTHCLLFCQLQKEGEARSLPAGPLASSWRGRCRWGKGDLPRRRRALLSPLSYQRPNTENQGHNELFHSTNTL